MLKMITEIDADSVTRLVALYAESMAELAGNFSGEEAMLSSYTDFLKQFVNTPGQFVLVEDVGGLWVSGLRAVKCGVDRWYIEAVETMPSARKQGHGLRLLEQSAAFLNGNGAHELFCLIHKNNRASIALHERCGFVPTDSPPVNGWGELDADCILFARKLP